MKENKSDRRIVIQNLVMHAAVLGTIAFKSGFSRIPAMDKELNAAMAEAGLQIGEGIPVMKAWIASWDNANLFA